MLKPDFFNRPCLDVAADLIGCTLSWNGVGGIVVETEAYAASDDPACHTASRPTAREFFESHPPGTAYVYLNYGMYWLLNVLASDGIVLFRAIEPTLNVATMRERRGRESLMELCSGPGKLGQSLGLSGSDHGMSLISRRRHLKARHESFDARSIRTDVRVGISLAVDRPWRFLLIESPHVSVRLGKAAGKSR